MGQWGTGGSRTASHTHAADRLETEGLALLAAAVRLAELGAFLSSSPGAEYTAETDLARAVHQFGCWLLPRLTAARKRASRAHQPAAARVPPAVQVRGKGCV